MILKALTTWLLDVLFLVQHKLLDASKQINSAMPRVSVRLGAYAVETKPPGFIQMVQFVYFLFVFFFLKLQPLCCCHRFSEKSCKRERRCVVFLNKASAGMRTFFYGGKFKEIVQMNVWSSPKSNWPVIFFFLLFFLLICLI